MHFRSNIILETSTETRVSFQSSAKTHLDRFRKTSERRKLRKSADAKKNVPNRSPPRRNAIRWVRIRASRELFHKILFLFGIMRCKPLTFIRVEIFWRVFLRFFTQRYETRRAALRSPLAYHQICPFAHEQCTFCCWHFMASFVNFISKR